MTDPGERKFRAVLEDAFDIVTVIEPDGTIRHPVPAFERVLGYPPGELEGRSILELIHPDDLARVREQFERSLGTPGPTDTIEARLLHRDGGSRIFRGRGRSMVDDPEIRGILLTLRDVTGAREGGPGTPPLERIMVREAGATRVVPVSRVDWIEAVGDYACLHVGDRTHVVRRTLTALAERLRRCGFARIHRSTIVNLARIRAIERLDYGDRTVVLEDGTRLRMSRTHRADVEARFERA